MVVVVTIDTAGWVVEALAQTEISTITVENIQPSDIRPKSPGVNKEHTSDHRINIYKKLQNQMLYIRV